MKQILYKLFEHQYLGRDEARTILQNIAQGKYNDAQVASLITVFLMRNISVEELCGFRDALLEMRVPVDLSEFAPIDIGNRRGRQEYLQHLHRGLLHSSRCRISGSQTWELRCHFRQRSQQRDGTARSKVHRPYRPPAPLDGEV